MTRVVLPSCSNLQTSPALCLLYTSLQRSGYIPRTFLADVGNVILQEYLNTFYYLNIELHWKSHMLRWQLAVRVGGNLPKALGEPLSQPTLFSVVWQVLSMLLKVVC